MGRLSPSPADRASIAERLLAWYERRHRALPWRESRNPYRIWISEVMLQQTRVETVRPYYERFVRELPTVEALARAPLDRVLKLWEGLGYYARARHLHRAAQIVVERHGGRVPAERKELLELPGIGPYTAGAIASIAYGRDEPVLDGNVRRVLCRLAYITSDPRVPQTERRLEALACGLLPPGRAGDFNQALMELGSTVCTPRRPRCSVCPVAGLCEAQRRGDPEALPIGSPKRTRPHHEVAVGLIWKDGELLLAKRPSKGLLGGLWELPGGKRRPSEALPECVRREVREELGIEVEVDEELTVVRHGYSHLSVTIHAFRCRWRAGAPQALGCQEWVWAKPRELSRYAFPRATQKILAVALDRHEERQEKDEQDELQQEE